MAQLIFDIETIGEDFDALDINRPRSKCIEVCPRYITLHYLRDIGYAN